MFSFYTSFSLLLVSLVSFSAAGQALPDYHKVPGLSGNLTSVGSDTFASLVSLWGEAFKTYYPNVNVQVHASGSSTAAPALIEGTAQFGPMSRQMRLKEVESFEREHGYPPTVLKVAIDAIGIFVHEDNPIKGLNFTQVDSIFSATMRCGGSQPVQTWSELGIEHKWAKRRIQLFGRNSVSGTYGYFKQTALCGGDFQKYVNEQPGSASVVQSVASSINTIGYSGIGYRMAGVKLVPIAEQGNQYVWPDKQSIADGRYPLSRYLYIYVNKHPSRLLSPLESEFIRFIYSRQGQEIVEKDGYIGVAPEVVKTELRKVSL